LDLDKPEGASAIVIPEASSTANHPLVGSLLAGYHLAFTVGAGSVALGILGALALLRTPQPPRPDLAIDDGSSPPPELTSELEQQAA
jgi:hypothetical protein